MKISSASKKVLASALSAAMVVAFAPTVAFGAQDTHKITVEYLLSGGVDKASGQDILPTSEELTVGADSTNAVTFTAPNSFTIGTNNTLTGEEVKKLTAAEVADITPGDWTLLENQGYVSGKYVVETGTGDIYKLFDASGSGLYWETLNATPVTVVKAPAVSHAQQIKISDKGTLRLESGSSFYEFKNWKVGLDVDADGLLNTADKDVVCGNVDKGAYANVSSPKIGDGSKLIAIAQYVTPTFKTEDLALNDADTDKGYATYKFTIKNNIYETDGTTVGTSSIKGTGKVVVTLPDGTTAEAAVSGTEAKDDISVAAQVGTYTVELVDGNGVVLDKFTKKVGAVHFTGAVFANPCTGLNSTDITAYYKVDAVNGNTYGAILTENPNINIANLTKDGKAPSATNPIVKFYDAKGNEVKAGSTAKVEEGAITTEVTSVSADSILGFSAEDYTLTYSTNAAGTAVDPAKPADDGYYVAITNAEGKVIAESYDTGVKAADTTLTIAGDTVANVEPGTYTITLYKVTKGTNGTGILDGTPDTCKAVSSKSVEVKGVAAPTWSYVANADAKKGGVLTLANAAGEGYSVYYKIGTVAPAADATTAGWTKYDEAKPGIDFKTTLATNSVYLKAVYTGTDKKVSPKFSNVVELVSYTSTNAMPKFTAFKNAIKGQGINGSLTAYYSQDAGVKAAIEAAEKTFVEAGYVVKTNGTEWNAAVIAADQSLVDAYAAVAKAELGKMLAGTTDKDGNLTKISTDNYEKALAAVAKVSADFAANHDSDKTNNVAKNGNAAYVDGVAGTGEITYAGAIDAAVVTASKAAVTYKKDDVDAAAAVTAQLKSTDAAVAEAGIKAYAALTDAQKELVAVADVAAAEAVVKAAAEAEAAAKLVASQDREAVKYVNSTKTKTVKLATAKKGTATITYKSKVSASGNAVVYTKVSGAKIKVAKTGKVTLKKVTKAGTYTGKVKVTCGDATRTVKVKFIVK